jgi:sugar phosphate isomerase/epimerase
MKTDSQKDASHNRRDFLKIAGASALATGLAAAPQTAAAEPKIKGFSCIPLQFWKEIKTEKTVSFEDWVRTALEFGLNGTEVFEPFVEHLDASGKARLAEFMRDAGLEASMYTIESKFSNPDEREADVAKARHAVDTALIFGANIVRLTAASHVLVKPYEGAAKEAAMKSVGIGIRECLDYAEEKQVMFALEDHPVLGTNVAEFMKIVELVDDDRLKINLDVGNIPGETVVELAELVKGRVVHTHMHTHVRKPKDAGGARVVDSDDVDTRALFSFFKKSGFDGWISIEWVNGMKGWGARDDLRLSIEYIKKEWDAA